MVPVQVLVFAAGAGEVPNSDMLNTAGQCGFSIVRMLASAGICSS